MGFLMDAILLFFQQNSMISWVFIVSLILILFGFVIYALWIPANRMIDDKEGDPFDLNRHAFGYAYTSRRHTKPFYPVNFKHSSYGPIAEGVAVGTIRQIEPQWVSDLLRAPAHDMAPKADNNAMLARILNALAGYVHGKAYEWGQGGEVAMAYAAQQIAQHIEEKADAVLDGLEQK